MIKFLKQTRVIQIVLSVIILLFCSQIGLAKTIKLGVLYPVSGGQAALGLAGVAGTMMAVEEINAKGGILGNRLECIVKDTQLKPSEALREARELIMKDEVYCLMGTLSSSVALQISNLAKENKILFVVGIAASPVITEDFGHRYVFRPSFNSTAYSKTAAKIAAQWPAKKWATIASDYEYGRVVCNEFVTFLKETKPEAEIVDQLWPKMGEKDYSSYIRALIQKKVEAVYSAVYGGFLVTFIKQAKPFGFFDKVKYISGDLGSVDLLNTLGKEVPEGLWGGCVYPFWGIKNPLKDSFDKNFHAKVSSGDLKGKILEYPSTGAVFGYIGVHFLAKAIEKAGSLDTEKVIDAWEGLKMNSVVGELHMRAYDHQCMYPMWFGETTFVPEYPFAVLKNLITFPANQLYRTEEEVKKIRPGR